MVFNKVNNSQSFRIVALFRVGWSYNFTGGGWPQGGNCNLLLFGFPFETLHKDMFSRLCLYVCACVLITVDLFGKSAVITSSLQEIYFHQVRNQFV